MAKKKTASTKSAKKLRYFGDGDSCGDGTPGLVYIGDTPKDVANAVEGWESNGPGENDTMVITIKMMTDREIAKLPEI